MKSLKAFVISIIFLSLLGIMTACGGDSGQPLETTTARQVKDQQTLKNFVLDARNYVEKNYNQATADFREENGPWWHGETYIFIIDEYGKVLFHAGIPSYENQQDLLIRDLNTGELIVDQLVREGSKSGGGFVEYHFDDPTTNQKENSRKITYVTPFRRSINEPILIVGAGFFPDDEL